MNSTLIICVKWTLIYGKGFMKKNKKIKIKKINELDLSDIEKRISKLSGSEESLYYQHLQDRKLELEKN